MSVLVLWWPTKRRLFTVGWRPVAAAVFDRVVENLCMCVFLWKTAEKGPNSSSGNSCDSNNLWWRMGYLNFRSVTDWWFFFFQFNCVCISTHFLNRNVTHAPYWCMYILVVYSVVDLHQIMSASPFPNFRTFSRPPKKVCLLWQLLPGTPPPSDCLWSAFSEWGVVCPPCIVWTESCSVCSSLCVSWGVFFVEVLIRYFIPFCGRLMF